MSSTRLKQWGAENPSDAAGGAVLLWGLAPIPGALVLWLVMLLGGPWLRPWLLLVLLGVWGLCWVGLPIWAAWVRIVARRAGLRGRVDWPVIIGCWVVVQLPLTVLVLCVGPFFLGVHVLPLAHPFVFAALWGSGLVAWGPAVLGAWLGKLHARRRFRTGRWETTEPLRSIKEGD